MPSCFFVCKLYFEVYKIGESRLVSHCMLSQGCYIRNPLIFQLYFQILSFVAQSERESIKKRQAEGIVAAKAKGVRFGRPEKNVPDDFAAIIKLWEQKKLPLSEVLKQCNMSEATFYRRLRECRLLHKK